LHAICRKLLLVSAVHHRGRGGRRARRPGPHSVYEGALVRRRSEDRWDRGAVLKMLRKPPCMLTLLEWKARQKATLRTATLGSRYSGAFALALRPRACFAQAFLGKSQRRPPWRESPRCLVVCVRVCLGIRRAWGQPLCDCVGVRYLRALCALCGVSASACVCVYVAPGKTRCGCVCVCWECVACVCVRSEESSAHDELARLRAHAC